MEQETKSEVDPEKDNSAKSAASPSPKKGKTAKSAASVSKSTDSPLEEDEWEDILDLTKEKTLNKKGYKSEIINQEQGKICYAVVVAEIFVRFILSTLVDNEIKVPKKILKTKTVKFQSKYLRRTTGKTKRGKIDLNTLKIRRLNALDFNCRTIETEADFDEFIRNPSSNPTCKKMH